jgi:hypothetical protein
MTDPPRRCDEGGTFAARRVRDPTAVELQEPDLGLDRHRHKRRTTPGEHRYVGRDDKDRRDRPLVSDIDRVASSE